MPADQFRPFAIQMVTKIGLQFSSTLIALLTIMLGSGTVASELENGLIHGILSRPIYRYQYILGKLFGLTIITSIYATVLYSAVLLIGAFYELNTITSLSFTQIAQGWFLYLLQPIAVLCITMYGSVSLKTVPNGILIIFIYILGSVGGMVEMMGLYLNNNSVIGTGIFVSLISPIQVIYSTMERVLLANSQMVSNFMPGASLSGSGKPASDWMFVYIGIYMLVFVILSVYKFSHKDIS
ncbi:MAG: hypothetical protein K0R71_1284 [Bacillales bacterium]|jgi:ABC-type transport system involved in multi-copper enzyme maturation permease subunit|nr:hypothetical protein [Bacillales bacterium]